MPSYEGQDRQEASRFHGAVNLMPSNLRRRGLRGLLNWVRKSPSSSPSRRIFVPNLHVLELEDRRVLSGLPAAYLSAARELVLSAGSQANDGQADTFLLRREGDDVRVSIDGQEVYGGRLADIARIRVEGSGDQDTLVVDYSGGNPLPAEGAGFHAGTHSQDSADALVLIGNTLAAPLDTITHEFQGLGAGSIHVALGDAAAESTPRLSYTGVESIRDATQARHLVFQDSREGETLTLTDGDPGNGRSQIVSSRGPRVTFDAPSRSLTIAAGAIDVDGTFHSAHATVDLRAQGELRVSGSIDVSDSTAGQRGGTILLSGDRIELAGGARLDASGEAGGGTILVGGGFQGRDASVRNASTTYIGSKATIRADAIGSGNGGTVVVWADQRTSFSGTISARGGPGDGQGGFAEVSGKRWLDFHGLVDLSAPSGPSGTLLLDPTTIVIDSAYAATLVAQLDVGNVSLWADEIIVQSAVDASGNTTTGTSLELYASTITLTSGANLITKEGDLVLDGDVVLDTGANVLLSTGPGPGGSLSVQGRIDGGGAGNQHVSLLAGTGAITIAGDVGSGGAIGSLTVVSSGSFSMAGANLAGSLDVTSGGSVAFNGRIEADGGVIVHGAGASTTLTADIVTDGAQIVIDDSVVLVSLSTITLDTTNGGTRAGGSVSLGAVAGGGADLTIEAGSGDIVLGGTVDGVRSLVLNSSGTTYLKGAVGGTAPVGSLTTDSGGATYVSANVTTNGGTQIYDDPVVLTNHVTFTDTGITGIFFNSTVDGDANGPWNLTVVTTKVLSEIQFNGAVGSGRLIGNVTILNAGLLTIGPDADMTLEGALVQTGFGPVRTAGDITTTGGGVSFSSTVTLTGDVSIDTGAGAGDISFQNAVNGVGLESLTLLAGGNIGFAGAIGAITPLAAITILDAQDVSVQGPIHAASLVQVTGSGTTTLRGNVTTSSAEGLDLTAPNVVLDGLSIIATGDGIVRLSAAVDLTGDVTIAAQGGIRFEGTVDSSGGGEKGLALWSWADISFLDAVGSGTASALGAITILFAENVEAASTIAAASFVQLVGMGTTTLSGDVTTSAAEGMNLTAAGIVLNELTITTTGGGIVRLGAPVDLNGDVAIGAEGTITFESTLASPGLEAKSLTLASDADIYFRDAVGAGPGNALGAITITTAADIQADSTITAASLVLLAGSGTTTLTADVTTSALEGIDLSAGAIVLDGLSLIATGDGIVRLNGPVVLGGDVAIDAADGGILFTAVATIDGEVGETNDLTLSAGNGSVSFNADIGDTQRIGSLIVTQADGGVTFGGTDGPDAGIVSLVRTEGVIDIGSTAAITDGIAVNAGDGNTISFITAGGSVRFNGRVELQSHASIDTSDGGNVPGAEIRFTRHALIDSQTGENSDLTLTAGLDGAVSFNADIGSVTALGQLVVTGAQGVAFGSDASLGDPDLAPIAVVRIDGAPLDPTVFSIDIGSVTAIGEGGIVFNAGEAATIAFITTGDKVRLNGAVELGSHASIDTSDVGNELGAEIRFTRHATIDSQTGERNDLTLTAGSDGTVNFNADIGATASLGRLIVTEAMGVAFGNDASLSEPDFSPFSTIRVIGHLDPLDVDAFAINVGSVTAIGEDGIALNAGNGNTLSLVTTADKLRLNGAVELQSHVSIDTSDAGGSPGAEIRFTVNALLDSEAGEGNGLTLTAGAYGTVSFNADIGTTAALGHLIVTDAKGVAIGNDTDLTDSDLAPVTTVWVDGDAPQPGGFAIDVGSVTAIGPDGIALGAGEGNLISLFTTADKVRLNGSVRLHSDALIDTSGAGIETIGADILVEGTIDGTSGGAAENLSLISHSGTIAVTGAVGASVPLGTLSLQNDLPESTGAALFYGAVHVAWLETFSQPYDVELLGGGSIADVVEFFNTGGVTLGDTVDDDLAFGNGVTSTASDTSVGGTVRTLDLDMQFAAVRVITDARLLTAGGNIGFAAAVDSEPGEHFDLELTALSGSVEFSADVGYTAPLNHLVVHSASSVVLGSNASPVRVVMADGGIDLGRASAIGQGILLNGGVGGLLAMSTSGGMVRLNGRVELQSDVSINSADEGEPAGAEIRFTAYAPIDSEAGETNRLILTAGSDGMVSFNADIGAGEALKQLIVTGAREVAFGNDANAADLDLAPLTTVRVDGDPLAPDAFAIDIGSVTAIDGGTIALNAGNGNTIQFITTGDKVRLNGGVELCSDALIDTSDAGNEPGAEIRFTLNAFIDSQLGERNGLTLTAGTDGAVGFNGDIGTREAPGHLIVTDAKGVVFGGEQLPDFAPLTTVRVGGDALSPGVFFFDIGSVMAIGADGIVLNAGRNLAGDPLTLTVASASGAMRFNGAVSLWSNVLLDTADADSSFGAQIRFTQYAPIDSQPGERNDLILTAGEAGVEFDADLGAQQTLDRLEITRADAGVVFGASDEPEAAGDWAPVRVVNADGGIDIGSWEVITGGIVFNAGVDAGNTQVITLTTIGTDVRTNGPVTLASHVAIDTGTALGDILFTDDSPIDSESGEKNDLVLTAGSGSVEFNADLGAWQALHWLEVTQADGGVFFGGADEAEEDLGDLGPVRQVIVEVGLDIGSQATISNGIFFNAGEWQELSVLVESGGAQLNGPVWLQSDLALDTSAGSGDITFTADATIDSQIAEHNSLRLSAGTGGVYFNADVGIAGGGDSRIGMLDVETSGTIEVAAALVQAFGDIIFLSSGDVTIWEYGETTVSGYTVTIRAEGLLTIENGAALQSDTGQVSNAPPVFRPDPDNPNEVLVPGQRVHTIKGTMGGNEDLGDNLERGVNFTLSIFWSDLKTTIIPNIHAGDVIEIFVGEDGQGEPVITHESDTGPIQFTLRRQYSLAYLATIETTVETWLVMTNDTRVLLDDVRPVNLNETSAVRGIKVAGDQFHPSQPIPEYLQPAPPRAPEAAAVVLEAPTMPLEVRATQYEEIRPPSEEGAERLRVWYLVRILPSGKEDARHPLSEDIASDPVKLFRSLREMGLPDGRYRIYLEELGFPRRMVYEFYKSGSSFGDPVRERGPGSNPVQEGPPAPAPAGKQGASAWPALSEAVAVADQMGGSAAATLSVKKEVWGPGGPETTEAPCDDVAHPAGAAVVVALGEWRARRGRHDWNQRVDEALENCSQRALTRGARLRRRLKTHQGI